MTKEELIQSAQDAGGYNMQAVELIAENAREYNLSRLWDQMNGNNWLRPQPAVDGYFGINCWITPKGMVYGVSHGGHDLFVDGILGLNYTSLEEQGWVHVSNSQARSTRRRSAAQLRVLDQLAVLDPNFDIRPPYGDQHPEESVTPYDVRPRRAEAVA